MNRDVKRTLSCCLCQTMFPLFSAHAFGIGMSSSGNHEYPKGFLMWKSGLPCEGVFLLFSAPCNYAIASNGRESQPCADLKFFLLYSSWGKNLLRDMGK